MKYRARVLRQYVSEIVLVLVFQLLAEATENVLYVSKARGHDGMNSCQNSSSPCRTLSYVIEMAMANDVIMLDPTHTEEIPYDTCISRVIAGDLRFISWSGSAIINCSGKELYFKGNSTALEFHGLTFRDTFLRTHDVSLTINHCSFVSSLQNADYLYLIDVSVIKPLKKLIISISSTNILEKNTAGTLNVVNQQNLSVNVEIRNITITNNHLEKAINVIHILGYVNFKFVSSEILNLTFSNPEHVLRSDPSLVYFSGFHAPSGKHHNVDPNNDIFSRLYSQLKKSHQERFDENEHGSLLLNEDSNFTAPFSLENMNILHNRAGIVRTLLCRGEMNITDTNILGNRNRGSAVVISTGCAAETLNVLVKNSSFVSNFNENNGPLVAIVSRNMTFSVGNCTFSRNQGGAVYISTSKSSRITFKNSYFLFSNSSSAFVSAHCGAQICVMYSYQESSDGFGVERESSSDCTIMRNSKSKTLYRAGTRELKSAFFETNTNLPMNMTNPLETSAVEQGLVAKRVRFRNPNETRALGASTEKTEAEIGGFVRMANETTKKGDGFNSERDTPVEYGKNLDPGLLLEDCKFHYNTGSQGSSSAALEVHSGPYVSLEVSPLFYLLVKRCVFVGNVAKDGTGAIYIAGDFRINISDSTFQNNAGATSGAIHFSGSTIFLQNCTLDSNSGGYTAFTQATGSVRFTASGTAFIENTRIIQTNIVTTISYESFHGSLAISSDSFDKVVLANSILDCRWSPSQEKVIVLEISHTENFVLGEGTSIKCPQGYRIRRRTISGSEESFECDLCRIDSYSVDRGIYKVNGSQLMECLPCPYGARCTKDLEALPNFWGYKIHGNPVVIQFSRCPLGYCCQIQGNGKGCFPYNTCSFGRYGRLCGKCMNGLTETLFTPSCRKPGKCKDYWFWPVAVVFVLGFTLYLLVQPDIFGIIYRYITWFRSATRTGAEPESPSISGMEHIVFFYYQAVDILTVQSSKNLFWDNHFTQFTVGLFNFDLRLNREGFACPFPGLSPVSKLLFNTLGVVSVLFTIPFIFLLHKVTSLFLPLRPPENGVYLSAFLKSVFLGYNVLARKCLTLLHCVTVDGVSCLFVNCNIVCYTWWQKLIWTLVFTYFLPFVLVLFFGAKKLYGRHISVSHLLLAFIFPLPYLSHWLLNKRRLRERIMPDTDGHRAVTLVLIGPYRVPDHVSAGAIYWESILIGRMLVLIIVAVLVKDPFLSSLALLLLCIINILLHIHVRPYKCVSDNRAEGILLFCLVLLALLNLPFMAYLSEGVLPAGPMSRVMAVFTWCENALVWFIPLICVPLVIAALLSQVVRLMIFLTKSILFACYSLVSCCCSLTTIQLQEEPDDLNTFLQ